MCDVEVDTCIFNKILSYIELFDSVIFLFFFDLVFIIYIFHYHLVPLYFLFPAATNTLLSMLMSRFLFAQSFRPLNLSTPYLPPH